jgi:multimeric flavodoxin WrbA
MAMKKILIISGSPKKDGNTTALIEWFCEGASSAGAVTEVINAAGLDGRAGCISCRACQKREAYGCVLKDGLSSAVGKMIGADVIIMATPLYFFSASAQIKSVFDRMFSLYKWDNDAGTMKTVLKGKTFCVLASAYEDIGLDALERPFRLTADYSAMKYASLLLPNAGVSGNIRKMPGVREKAVEFSKKVLQL